MISLLLQCVRADLQGKEGDVIALDGDGERFGMGRGTAVRGWDGCHGNCSRVSKIVESRKVENKNGERAKTINPLKAVRFELFFLSIVF